MRVTADAVTKLLQMCNTTYQRLDSTRGSATGSNSVSSISTCFERQTPLHVIGVSSEQDVGYDEEWCSQAHGFRRGDRCVEGRMDGKGESEGFLGGVIIQVWWSDRTLQVKVKTSPFALARR